MKRKESQPSENRKKTIQKRAKEILDNLGLTWKDLKNKIVLDIGAGDALLAKTAQEKGLDIISVDIKKPAGKIGKIRYIRADAQKLPFDKNIFDLVVSHAGPITIIPDKKIIANCLKESLRVLKTGGEFRFGPGNIHSGIFGKKLFSQEEDKNFTINQRINRIQKRSLEFLKKLNPEIRRRRAPKSKMKLPSQRNFYIIKK